MSVQSPGAEPVKPSGPDRPELVLAVLLSAIGNDWTPGQVEILAYILLALFAVAVLRD